MVQYRAVKAQYHDSILFFRMGDFYEMFYDDAKTASRVLGITLTSRGHGKVGDIPLAGFPYHALDTYLSKMIRAGYRVAICEQTEDPKLAKGVVKRGVVQVVTPGTIMEDNLLDTNRNNYLAAVTFGQETCGFSYADVTTGEFYVTEIGLSDLKEQLNAVMPREVLVSDGKVDFIDDLLNGQQSKPLVTVRDSWIFSREYGYEILLKHFKTASLKGFGCDDLNPGLGAAGAVLHYLKETKKNELPHIRQLFRVKTADYMVLDNSTRRNLEITSSMAEGGKEGSLLSIVDKTNTPMGGRTVVSWLNKPLIDRKGIELRLESVDELVREKDLRRGIVSFLKNMSDIERLITRIVMNRATPRDVAALGTTLELVSEMKKLLQNAKSIRLSQIFSDIDECSDISQKIKKALVDRPPTIFTPGNVIRQGYSIEFDELKEAAFSGKEWIVKLQKTERERTGIPSLKVGYNKVFGYYIEVTKTHLQKIPEDYIRKQTLVNAERFITQELKEMEETILKAEDKMAELEHTLFEELRDWVSESAEPVQRNGHLIGELDTYISFADTAEENRYIKPVITKSHEIRIKEGRHPVVEKQLPPGEQFIPNDVMLNTDSDQLLIITGPNMAGKSTFIRQAGLIVLLAQIGSFVPAVEAEIGIVDRIFTRVGAQDNLSAGESTFLVEMNETANILNNATPESLILLDEIGRGTSTFDGLSIAWAVAEYIHDNENLKAKTLFATHYHELTELALVLDGVKNYNVAVREWGDSVVFLRKIVPGGCDHSYGIHVARLAGLPKQVIERAREVLKNLEANELTPNSVPKMALGEHYPLKVAEEQLSIFPSTEEKIRNKLAEININEITPLEALQVLNDLIKSAIKDESERSDS
ncbi:DNA mismatch repair protein MutS [bacterium]|nr:DNA mismatch repair protein MutS [bacterium]